MKRDRKETKHNPDLKRSLRAFWDSCNTYWEILASESSTQSPYREWLSEFVPKGSLVLDLGCGNCANSFYLKEKARYVGIDLSLTGLQRAVQPGLALVCCDADFLPFADKVFDTVVATFVLEHLVNPQHTLQEVCRVVRPKGRIIFLGGTWDFPWWYPNSLRSFAQSKWWRLLYALRRFFGQMMGWMFGRLPFLVVQEPDVFRVGYSWDEDAVYVVWTYEIVQFLKKLGCELVHWEVDDRLLGSHPVVRLVKRFLLHLPPYRYAGGTLLLVFEKQGTS